MKSIVQNKYSEKHEIRKLDKWEKDVWRDGGFKQNTFREHFIASSSALLSQSQNAKQVGNV